MNTTAFLIGPESIEQYEFSWSYSRNEGIKKILKKAHENIKKEINKEYKIRIWTADYPKEHYDKTPTEEGVIELNTVSSKFENKELFPDFALGTWWDMKMEDLDKFTSEIRSNNSKKNIIDDRIFWVGSSLTSHNRNIYLNLCNQHPSKFKGIRMNEWIQVDNGARTIPDFFIPIKDQCDYKYLIDIAGYGYGSRIKFIPFCNRPMFVNERGHFTWSCVEVLKHNLHIPVEENLGDLVSKFEWAQKNEELVFNNSEKLLNLCINSLSFENVCKHAASLILSKVKTN